MSEVGDQAGGCLVAIIGPACLKNLDVACVSGAKEPDFLSGQRTKAVPNLRAVAGIDVAERG
jgi:hypothetical protein